MKLLRTLENNRYGATTYIYELPKGLKVVHTKDPKTVETTVNVVFKAGAVYDILSKLPKGTAHMLEHMLSANPNRYFKTKNSLEKFKQGTLRHAAMYDNAHTGDSLMWFDGTINSKFETRLIKLIYSYIDYPVEDFEKYIEKERKIIIAERNNEPKKEESRFYSFQEQFIEPQRPGFTHNVLGEISDIEKIKPEHLIALYNLRFSKGNTIITIQSNKEISKQFKDYLYKIDDLIESRRQKQLTPPKENLKNEKKIGYFKDIKYASIELQFGQFKPIETKVNYHKTVSTMILSGCLNKLCFDILREKYHMIYSWELGSRYSTLFYNTFDYLSLTTEFKNANKLIKYVDKLLKKDVVKFLKSKKGKEWLTSIKSKFIYPGTVSFNSTFAFNIGAAILEGYELHETDKLV